MSQSSVLLDYSKSAAKRYLQNVIVIDDEADFKSEGVAKHRLDVRTLVESFATQGIICSTLAPQPEDSLRANRKKTVQRYAGLALAADIILLDWQMTQTSKIKDKASLCKAIIQKIIQDDPSCLHPRLIVVYTGEDTSLLPSQLEPVLKKAVCAQASITHEDNVFRVNRLRIVFLQKSPVSSLSQDAQGLMPQPEQSNTIVRFEDLPERIIKEFSALVDGALPAAMFNAVATIRENLSGLLSSFSSEMDEGFVQHLILTGAPSDGAAFLLDILKSNLFEPVERHAFLQHITDKDFLSAWRETYPEVFDSYGLKVEDFEDILWPERFGRPRLSKSKVKKLQKNVSEKASAAIRHFSRLCTVRRDALTDVTFKALPDCYLEYGTVVEREEKFYICLLPKCDGVRLNSGESIMVPLLKLKLCSSGESEHFCLYDQGEYKSFYTPKKRFWTEIELVPFKAEEGCDCIKAMPEKKKFVFISSSVRRGSRGKPDKYRWVAHLRDSFMLALHQKVFGNMSRIGTDQFEWNRRNQRDENSSE